jgi:hypothetical protein
MKLAQYAISLRNFFCSLIVCCASVCFANAFIDLDKIAIILYLFLIYGIVSVTRCMSWFPPIVKKIIVIVTDLFLFGILVYTLYSVNWTRFSTFVHGVLDLYVSAHNESFHI